MTGTEELKPPRDLIAAVKADLSPVRPLGAPWRRVGPVVVWAALAAAVVLSLVGLRRDMALLGWGLTWGAFFLEFGVGLGLVVLALARAIPGRGAATIHLLGGAVLGVVLLIALSFLTALASPGVVVANPLVTKGPACFAVHLVLGLSAFGLAAFLILRAKPVRSSGALILAGLGTAMMAEGVYRLHCGISDLRHVALWHGGAIAMVVLTGLAAGLWSERRAAREMEERLSGRS